MSFTVRTLREHKPKKESRLKKTGLFLARFSGPLLAYIHKKRSDDAEAKNERKRIKKLKKFMVVLIGILCAFVLLGGTVKALVSLKILTFDDVASITGTTPQSDEHGFINILLLGQGDKDHDGFDLTDTIMVASIDAANTQSVTLLSIPRDLYFLQTEKMGQGRINSLYRDYKSALRFGEAGMSAEQASQEAMHELAREVSKALNLEIPYVVKVDFIGFVKVVDEFGGVEIDVPEAIVDTTYPDNNYGYQTFRINAGPQTLDGQVALKYARTRHTTSDFSRSARQQQILSALAHKAKESGLMSDPARIASLFNIVSEHLESTMSLREIIGLAKVAKKVDRSQIRSMQLNNATGIVDSIPQPGGFLYNPPRDQFEGASVLLPLSIPELPVTWDQVQAFVKLLTQYRQYYKEPVRISVLNASAPSGSANLLATELIRYGFNVQTIDNASLEELDTSFVAPLLPDDERFDDHASFLGTLLGFEKKELPLNLPPEEIEEVTIVLGSDFDFARLHTLIPSLP